MEDIIAIGIGIFVLVVVGSIILWFLGMVFSAIRWGYEEIREWFQPEETVFGGDKPQDIFGDLNNLPDQQFKPSKPKPPSNNVFRPTGSQRGHMENPNTVNLEASQNGNETQAVFRGRTEKNDEAPDWVTGQIKKQK